MSGATLLALGPLGVSSRSPADSSASAPLVRGTMTGCRAAGNRRRATKRRWHRPDRPGVGARSLVARDGLLGFVRACPPHHVRPHAIGRCRASELGHGAITSSRGSVAAFGASSGAGEAMRWATRRTPGRLRCQTPSRRPRRRANGRSFVTYRLSARKPTCSLVSRRKARLRQHMFEHPPGCTILVASSLLYRATLSECPVSGG